MKEKIYIALGILGFFLLFGIVGRMDYEDWQQQRIHYCHMRMVYELQASEGVPAQDRMGWPNFKDEEYECDFTY